MGVVYRARQVSLNRLVALKMVRDGQLASAQSARRFQAEAEAAAKLDHPNIVPIYAFGELEGHPFLAMRLIEGSSLAQELHGTPMDAPRAARLMATLSRAVHFAHQRGVLHRDLKPANVLLEAGGQPHVTDFGVAKVADRDAGLTQTSDIIGSPNYMSPEQARGGSEGLTTASDVYSLGAILFEMLTGRAPFRAETPLETMRKVVEEEPTAPHLLYSFADPELETICLKCLEKDPQRRYPSAEALAEDVERWLRGEPIAARPATVLTRVRKWIRRKPAIAALVIALHLVFVLGAIGVLWQWHRATESAERLRRRLYVADIKLAQVALDENNLGRAAELLRKYQTPEGAEDLRGFEWRYLWSLCRGDETSTFLGHTGIVTCVAFSPDGKLLATGGFDKTVRILELSTKQPVVTLRRFERPVLKHSLAFSPDGKLLAARDGRVIVLWDTATWREVRELACPSPDPVNNSLAFSPDGRRLAAKAAGSIWLWETATWQKQPMLKGDADFFGFLLSFSFNGQMLATVGESHVEVLNLETHTALPGLPDNGAAPRTLAFSPRQPWLAAGFSDGSVRLWDVSRWRTLTNWHAHGGFISALAFSTDGQTLATGSADQVIHLWSLPTIQKLSTLRGHLNEVWDVAFAPDGQTLASASKDGSAKLWSTVAKPDEDTIASKGFPIRISRDSRTTSLLLFDGTLEDWDIPSARLVKTRRIRVGQEAFANRAVSSDGKSLAIALPDGPIQIWSLEKETVTSTLPGKDPDVRRMKFSPDDQWLAAPSERSAPGGRIQLWNLASMQVRSTFEPASSPVEFSHDARILACVKPDYVVELRETYSGRRLRDLIGNTWRISTLAFSPDDKWIASSGADNSARLWNVASGRLLTTFKGHSAGLTTVTFLSDGKTIATGSTDKTVRLWNIATGEELLTIKNPPGYQPIVAFSADGSTLVLGTAYDAGFARFLRAPRVGY